MKRTIVQIIFFIYCIANVYPQYSTIWQLGKTDNSSKEFALAPDGKIDLLSPALGIIKNIFMQANIHRPIFHTLYRDLQQNGLALLTGQDNAEYNFLF